MTTNSQPSAGTRKRWWRYAAFALVVASFSVAVATLAVNGTLKRWFASDRHVVADGQLWTCGMHPQAIQSHPGDCPICHMELTPLNVGGSTTSPDGSTSAAITIDTVVVQNMGIRTSQVASGPLRTTIRAVGYFSEAEPNIHDVNLRLSGWIETLHANTVGMHVEVGDPLFELYSPQLQAAVEELIAARQAAGSDGSNDELSAKSLAAMSQSVERKLLLLGVQKQEINRLAKLDTAPRAITFTSPVVGHVTEKPVVQGAAVKEGERVLRIVDHSLLWLDAQIYESQVPFISLRQKAAATVLSLPGKTFEGEVIFIHPHVDPATRTVMVRLAIPNESMSLRPGMYGTVQIAAELASHATLVPREAVIDTGTRQIAFLARGEGHFEPREVKLGVTTPDGMAQILDGLAPGETVVTSGQFLLDAESRVKEAILKHLSRTSEQPGAAAQPAAPHDAHTVDDRDKRDAIADHKVDPLVTAYLALSDLLGKPQESDEPADVQAIVAAVNELVRVLPTEQRATVEKIRVAATAMAGHPLAHQRAMFKPLSDAVIALVDQMKPSDAIADKLFVMHCPMADNDHGANWLQTIETIANPYFATTMKRCGEVKRAIDLKGAR